VCSWQVENSAAPPERVAVKFHPQGAGTEITVLHEYISDETLRAGREKGWAGCLEGLAAFAEATELGG
jgi:uncharacterized protein YndB with AHSA1/START domain